MTVVAFDIDGTLTRDEVLTVYRELQNRGGFTIGIITRRPKTLSEPFVEENNLQTEFVRNRVVKTIAFENIESEFEDDRYIYVGNRISDMLYAKVSNWEFVQAGTADSLQSII